MIAEDYELFLEWLEKFARAKSSMHHPIAFSAHDPGSGEITVDNSRCSYVRKGDNLRIWFLHPGQEYDPDKPNLDMSWTDTGWEMQTFLGPGLWNSQELAEECVDRLLDEINDLDLSL